MLRSRPKGIPENVLPAAMYREKASAPEMPVVELDPAKTTAPAVPVTAEPAPVTAPVPERRELRRDGRDRELERPRKIEANYEKDKAALEREKALARSESHDIGHAEGNGEEIMDIEKFVKEHVCEVKQNVKRG
jgi:hypothetical protein